jgi:death-on-curing protein
MIDISIAHYLHEKSIGEFGGGDGTRDENSLDAALNRPFATFDGIDLYPTPVEKAAALLESVVINHPFIDGNKRTGYLLMKYLLFKNGIGIIATNTEKYEVVYQASTGAIRFDAIKTWLSANTKSNIKS